MKDKNYRALLITNSTFPQDPSLADLEGPRNDAAVLRAALVDPAVGMFSPDRVRLVTERTEFNVRREIEKFFATANKHETLFLYYSGHGILTPSMQLYLCAHDTRKDELATTAVPSTWISSVIEESAAQVTVIILDCCHAGAFKSGDDDLTPSLAGQGRFLLASCRPNQLAGDADTDNHASIFTAVIAEGLIEGAPDLDNDGVIRLQDLHLYADARLRDAGKPRPHANFVGIGNVPMAFRPHGYPPEISPHRIDLGTIRLRKRVSGKRFDVIGHNGEAGWWTPESVESWVSIEKDEHGIDLVLTPPKGKHYATVTVRDHNSGLSTSGVITVDRKPIPAWLSIGLAGTLVVVILATAAWWIAGRTGQPDPQVQPYPYSAALPPETIVTPRSIDGRPEQLFLVNSETGNVGAQITNTDTGAKLPAVVPGRSSIAYQVNNGDYSKNGANLLVAAADGSSARNLFAQLDCKWMLQPSFDPKDIEQVALACIHVSKGFLLYVVRTNGGPLELDRGTWIDDVTFSPDGTRLAYFNGAGVGGSPPGIYTVRTDGTQPPGWIADGRNPAWSPDGSQIAFRGPMDVLGGVTPSDAHIFLVKTDGSNLRQLTSGTGADDDPTWSPDGSKVAFRSNRDRKPTDFSLWMTDVSTGSAHRVSPDDPASVGTEAVWASR